MDIVNALPLKDGIKVLEIGCATGVAAREIVSRIGKGKVLAIDRSKKAIEKAIQQSKEEIQKGSLVFVQSNIEDFELPPKESKYDIAFAARVGALDGRHPELEQQALEKIANALKPNGKLFIDAGNPLREIKFKHNA